MKYLIISTALLLSWAPAFAAVTGADLLTGKEVSASGKRGTVVAFLSAKCPCSNSHLTLLKDLAKRFPDFAFVAVHANADEPEGSAAAYFRAAALPFPVIQDARSKLADEFHAYKTPHVFVLGAKGEVVYKGGATNSADATRATKFFLEDALADLQAGHEVRTAEGRTLGCVIAR